MPEPRRVAVIVSSATDYGRRLLSGIASYARERGPWRFYLALSDAEATPQRLARWNPEGVIAQVSSPQTMQNLLALGKPVVNASSILDDETLPHICADDDAVARIAAEHFIERGFSHFAFYAHVDTAYARHRAGHYCSVVREHAGDYSCFRCPVDGMGSDVDWETREIEIERWLSNIPRPLALFACNDLAAIECVGVCQRAGIRIPDQVAILGVDNDDNLCEFSYPPLSSIDINTPRIGYEAASMLDKIMTGQPLKQRKRLMEPVGVVTRQSTDVLAADDHELVKALHFIRENACQDIDVEDLLGSVGVSRRSLERRFRKALGRSPREQIRRVRLEEARKLLARTDIPLSEIADRCGFKYLSHLSLAFKKFTGMSPSNYRRRFRSGQ